MNFDRRRLFAALAAAASLSAATPALARRRVHHDDELPARRKRGPVPDAEATPMPVREVAGQNSMDGASFGLRPNAAEDQTKALQKAIDQAAAARALLHLTPGFYRAGGLKLPAYTAIAGVPGTTRIVMSDGSGLMTGAGDDHISLTGLILDGADVPLPKRRGLVHLAKARFVRISDCEIVNAGGNGVMLEAIEGEVAGNTITAAADAAIFSLDARSLKISGNTIRGAGNNGILIWRTDPGDDGTLVVDNRIESIMSKAGGSGENGNAINVFRADNVIVRGNRIRNAAFSAVRGNKASNLQILGNTSTGLGETALYAEFGFQGAVIANNIVDGAALGISVTNFNQGGRLAVVQGNLIRNVVAKRPPTTDPNDASGVGIGIEADTMVSGNVVENAAHVGIAAGWGPHLRDVAISANMVRGGDYGITVSVAPGAGTTLVTDNLISEARRGAIVGVEWNKAVTGDLSKDGAARYAQLTINGNRVR